MIFTWYGVACVQSEVVREREGEGGREGGKERERERERTSGGGSGLPIGDKTAVLLYP